MQNDFGARGGMFDRAGIELAPIRAAIEPTARALAAARRAQIPVSLLLADCTAEPIGAELSRSNHDASLLLTQMMLGWVSSSTELIRALEPA